MDMEMWKKDLPYQNFWRWLIVIIQEKPWCNHRFKVISDDEASPWDWIFEPMFVSDPFNSCIESGRYGGPVAKWEVEWVEIDPITEKKTDSHLPAEWIDCTEQICERLTLEGFEFSIINHFIRITTGAMTPKQRDSYYKFWKAEIKDCEIWEKDIRLQNFWQRLFSILKERWYVHRCKIVGDDEIIQCYGLTETFDCCIELTKNDYVTKYDYVVKWNIEWIEIDPIVKETDHPLTKSWVTDYTEHICEKLTSEGIEFTMIDGNIRVMTTP